MLDDLRHLFERDPVLLEQSHEVGMQTLGRLLQPLGYDGYDTTSTEIWTVLPRPRPGVFANKSVRRLLVKKS